MEYLNDKKSLEPQINVEMVKIARVVKEALDRLAKNNPKMSRNDLKRLLLIITNTLPSHCRKIANAKFLIP